MTISSSTRRAGPYDCDGVDTTFNFSFKVFAAADVKVTLTSPAGVDTVISSYSVTLNPDQDATPGGFITTVATYGIGSRITITGAMPETQGTTIPNAGGFFPKVIEAALDKLTILVQQLRDESNRSFRAGVTSPGVVDVQPGVPNSLIGWDDTATGIENKTLTTAALVSGPSDENKTVQINGAGVPVLNAPAAARTALGATVTGAALFTAADAAAGRAAIGGTAVGSALFTAADQAAARTAIGARVVNRNRFANGSFQFDQRNNGAAVTVNAGAEVRLQDCWTGAGRAAGGVFTVQQMATGGPGGSPTYLRCTVTAADAAIPAANAYWVRALLEGFDTADLGWGAAGALPISVGFWFRASITGTFSGSVQNAAAARSYPVSWSYPTANVWQFVPIQNIPGDVTGTWPTTNVRAMQINFCLGAGTSAVGPGNAWAASGSVGVTGTTNLMATLGATFELALVQPEAGPVCTPFEWTPHTVGLARVRRYFRAYRAANDGVSFAWAGAINSGGNVWAVAHFDPPMRATPTTDLAPATFTLSALSSPVVAGNSSTAVVVQYTATATGNGSAVLVGGQVNVQAEL